MYFTEIKNFLSYNIEKLLQNIKDLNEIQEIRIRINKPVIFQLCNKEIITNYCAKEEDIKTMIQRFSNYSIYAFEEEIRKGYITIKGGHRVGICGICVIENNRVKTIKNISSINIRICKQVKGCSNKLISYIVKDNRILNTIIISPPKCGKTTLLRDLTRNISNGFENVSGKKVCAIDERSEICSCYKGIPQMDVGIRTDVLDNCPKSEGIIMAIRSMGPEVIVCDEIGTYKDMESIILALNSGVSLVTTIHGYNEQDLYRRSVFKDIIDNSVFSRAIILSNKKGIGTIEYIYDFVKGDKLQVKYYD
ncbi:stage III sporulation protein AA [Haloimpatiens sp. FM7330]|uniref:stage III sporulation protein AA n=1 Tax=Haloimpatiens sp. FM7330 TaxID=3298610 RepID=UPI003630F115